MVNQSDNFATLFEQKMSRLDLRADAIIKAKVIDITQDFVIVDAGLKSEALIPNEEFKNREGVMEIKVGDEVEVAIEKLENGAGGTILSREKAQKLETWNKLEQSMEDSSNVSGMIVDRVRGGFIVELEGGIRAFLPASMVDVRPVKDISYLEGKELEFKLIKLEKPNNIIVSRKDALISESEEEREAVLAAIQEGQEITGIVKNLTNYGAFVDLGGIDGLLHITDMSWRRIKHPNEVIKVGEKIRVKVLKFDRDKKRVSLGLKHLGDDPWVGIARRYPINTRIFGKITNVTDYGCFVEIEEGIEGLIHMSEMDWTNKNVQPAKIVSPGQEVEVMVLEVNEDRRRISLGLKQCKTNPWEAFAANHTKGEKIKGQIKSITDFGIFVGLEGSIDGLVHMSDISWTDAGDKAIRNYKKGQEVEAVILAIDAERERISLGVKQLEEDVYATYFATHPKGTSVEGKVTEVTPKLVTVSLGDGIEGKLRLNDISNTNIKDANDIFTVNDDIKATILSYDKKARVINLSTKELFADLSSGGQQEGPKLGDLLKEQMDQQKDEEESSE